MTTLYQIRPLDITDDRIVDAYMGKDNAMIQAQHIANQTGKGLRVVERKASGELGESWTVRPEE